MHRQALQAEDKILTFMRLIDMLKNIHRERVGKIIKAAIFIFILMKMELAFAERVRINDPEVSGYALDLCREWANNCGKPAADAYCQSKGFVEAIDFDVVYDSPPTRVINTRQICDQPGCDRIVTVVCRDRRHYHGYDYDGR